MIPRICRWLCYPPMAGSLPRSRLSEATSVGEATGVALPLICPEVSGTLR